MTSKQNNNTGCLLFFLMGILSILSFIILYVIFPLSSNTAIVISISLSVILLKLVFGNSNFKSLIKSGIIIYILFFGLIMVVVFLLDSLKTTPTEDVTFKKEEKSKKETIINNNETTVLYTSKRNWIDNYGNHFSGEFSVREDDYNRLNGYLNSYSEVNNKYFWRNLYDYIEQKDAPSLDLIMEAFTQINQEKKLNQMEFAEMVVSFIQDIPYSFVLQNECPSPINYDDSNREILSKCPDCCIGNIKFGIQNPVSFMKNLKGDCDTRTVIIYSILKHFNFDVAIVNSNYYQHSIIGLNLPASGDYKLHHGKKYILWETTAKYYKAGELPLNFNNVKHWDIVLTSK